MRWNYILVCWMGCGVKVAWLKDHLCLVHRGAARMDRALVTNLMATPNQPYF